MKYVIILSILALAGAAKAEAYHGFTDQEGRTVQASIAQYDAGSGKIQLELPDGRKVWVDPLLFSRSDQKIISQWIQLEPYRNPSLFKVSIEEQSGEWQGAGTDFNGASSRKKTTYYILELKNTSTDELKRLRVEYCIYRTKKSNGQVYTEASRYSKTIGDLDPQQQLDVKTSKCISLKKPADGLLDEVVGGRFRIYQMTPDGPELVRELCYPSSLSEKYYPWKESDRAK